MALRAGFTSFPARRCFLFLAVGHSPSYRQRKRSLDSARDDDSGRTFFQRTLYTIQRISIPTLSFRAQREIFLALCSFLLLSRKDSPSLLSHIRRYTGVQERSLGFARDDDTGIVLSKHIRCTLREINPFPHTVISSTARNLPCTPRFLASFAEAFPFSVSHIGRYTGVQERSRTSLGMTLREYRSLTLPIYFPCNNDTREAPSTFAALLFFMRRTTPLNPTT